jgi:lactate dehydrogenase-like 2-hydroxyacid dehydrogenase
MPRHPQILAKVKEADAFFVKISTKVDKELIDAASHLKYVGVCSTAFDAIDAKYARTKGVTVCNLGGYSTGAVSEFFFAALFEVARDLEAGKIRQKELQFELSPQHSRPGPLNNRE